MTGRPENYDVAMSPIADYLASIGTLIVITTFDDFPELIPLGCELNRMPNIEPFRLTVTELVTPILARTKKIDLPPDSYRSS